MDSTLQWVKKPWLAELIGQEPQERMALTILYKDRPDQEPEVVRLITKQIVGRWVEVEVLGEPEPAL